MEITNFPVTPGCPPNGEIVGQEVNTSLIERTDGSHAFLTAPRIPHKALVRMRLAGTGDVYVPVRNPLHDP